MAAGLWTEFCGNPECTPEAVKKCISGCIAIFYPDTCLNHGLVISIDFLLLLMFLYILTENKTAKNTIAPPLFMTSALLNGGLGLAYLSFGIWKIYDKLNIENTICPLHVWLVLVIQGFTWLLLGCILGRQKLHLSLGTTVKLCSTIIFLFGGFLSLSSLWGAIVNQADLIKAVIDILCFLGATLSLICAFQRHNHRKSDNNLSDSSHYVPLKDGEASPTSDNCSNNNVTPFATAGFLSRMSFWWLNPLMKQANGKILEKNDFPRLRQEDQAQTWYSKYVELSKKRQEMHEPPSVLSVIFSCQKKPILVSGFFQLVKVLALSTGPLFLKALIDVTEGKAAFRYEGYALAGGLFLAKCLESLSERQLFFRTRLVGLQVRSLLSAAIYQKQLRLSNIARITHSPGDIMNYVALDAFKMSEFPYWFHMMWAIPLQLILALLIVYHSVGLGTVAALVSLILSMLASTPLAKFQHKYQSKLVMAQDKRLKAMTEALANMKVLKLYAWERHFQNAIEKLRKEEAKWVAEVLTQRGYYLALFWSSSIVASVATFLTCYFLGIPLSANDIFTFLATLRIVQEPLRIVSDVAGAYIEAKVALHRITKFLEAPELQLRHSRQKCDSRDPEQAISIMATEVSWQDNSEKATLRNINFVVRSGEKVAICGGVGSGKSTLLAAILGEVPNVKGLVHVNGKIAYVSQTAWIQTGTIQDNILFGSPMDPQRYQEVLRKSSLVKDLEMFPMGDNTEIGERGVNLSGGQKQRIQLARALYKDADVYLLDDPFSAVDAHTATSLFNEYVMGALSGKTVMLVTHQVDFLSAFDSVLFVSDGILLKASSYEELLASSKEFQNLVNSQNEAIDCKKHTQYASSQRSNKVLGKEIQNYDGEQFVAASGDQLINQEERETGDVGLKPYIQYLKHDKGFLYFSLATMAHAAFVVGQYLQNYLLAADIRNGFVGKINLITTYVVIGCILPFFLLLRSFSLVFLSYRASESIFPTLLSSLFRAPMSFYDSTPIGRILTRVSSDMSTVDLEVAFRSNVALGSTIVVYFSYVVLAIISWPVLFVIIPMIYLTSLLQRYYLASAKEMMRINGTTKSLVANHLAESIAGAKIIRAFGEEERFFMKNLEVIDMDASPYFHIISANEWLIQRLEILCAIVVSFSVLALTWLPLEASSSGFVGLELSYGLSLSVFLVSSVQFTCMAENIIVSVERLEQYMHIPSEAVEVIQGHQPPHSWPLVGRVEICDLKIRYRPNAPLVLQGISCVFEGGHKIGIVGRTGSGKTTLVSALFRLVEPTEGRISIDGIDISTIGLHDLRANLGIIPQDPTLFSGSVRYNLDPLSRYTDQEIWEVLEKCQLRRAIEEKEVGLDSSVVQDGSNWSMGQRQLFCLGRALLKRSKVLVLDEATASIDSATDSILQKTIRSEFGDCTVITVAHRIPTVIDCNMVLAMSDGKLMEYDEPAKLMSKESSLFGQLVKEYWARTANGNAYSEDSH